MKFILKNVRNGCRLGLLTDIGAIGDTSLATPLCMLYTRSGSAPYLTKDMLNRVPSLPQLSHLPIPSAVDLHQGLQEYEKGMKSFASMQETILYCSLQDPAMRVPSGYNDKIGSSVWTKGGKVKLDVDSYMSLQVAIRPDIYQALYDGDTDRDSSRKRLYKSVERSLAFLDSCLAKHAEFQELKHSSIFASLVGGMGEEERVRCAKEMAKRPVDGYCLEGFHNYGPPTEGFDVHDIKELLHSTMAELAVDKPRLMHSVWCPHQVLLAIKEGVDIFDSSYTYIVSERGGALSFTFELPVAPRSSPLTSCECENESTSTSAQTTVPASNNSEGNNSRKPFEINMKEKIYMDDFGPLVKDCKCYTCQNHTCAYINHLLNTSELLAGVLLTIHNIHHYSLFFAAIRDALENDRFDELQRHIEDQMVYRKTCQSSTCSNSTHTSKTTSL